MSGSAKHQTWAWARTTRLGSPMVQTPFDVSQAACQRRDERRDLMQVAVHPPQDASNRRRSRPNPANGRRARTDCTSTIICFCRIDFSTVDAAGEEAPKLQPPTYTPFPLSSHHPASETGLPKSATSSRTPPISVSPNGSQLFRDSRCSLPRPRGMQSPAGEEGRRSGSAKSSRTISREGRKGPCWAPC